MRVGIGYDVHPLAEGRRLVLGGVEVPYSRGLSGHSDADVLVHAIIDALLGATASGDLGLHFPSTDPKYKDISSLLLLRQIGDMLRGGGWRVVNIDSTLIAQEPRLSPFFERMRQGISQALGLKKEQIGVKATTPEGLGFAGRGEGIAACAVALVEKHEAL